MTHLHVEPPASAAVLPANSLAVVRAMALGEVAWQDADELAEVLGWTINEVQDELATLDVAGWLHVWNRPESPAPFVTFSPLGASRLGLRLIEVGPTEIPRWASPAELDPPLLKARGVSADPRGGSLESIVDDRPGPYELAERADVRLPGLPGTGTLNINALPLPIMLRGQSLSWQGPHMVEKLGKCPGCRSRPLGPREYCLCCDRWGFDHLLTKSDPSRSSFKDRTTDRRQQAGAFRELMKTKRKAHRRTLRQG